jgi:thioredoxin-related protein
MTCTATVRMSRWWVSLGIAIDPMVEPVQSLVTGVGINYAVLMGELETLVRWKVKAFPTTFLINKEGEIYKQYLGYQPKSVFLTDIEEILD